MEVVSQLLQRDEGLSSAEIEAQTRKGFRFDLCPCCHKKFLKDPLGRESVLYLRLQQELTRTEHDVRSAGQKPGDLAASPPGFCFDDDPTLTW